MTKASALVRQNTQDPVVLIYVILPQTKYTGLSVMLVCMCESLHKMRFTELKIIEMHIIRIGRRNEGWIHTGVCDKVNIIIH